MGAGPWMWSVVCGEKVDFNTEVIEATGGDLCPSGQESEDWASH